MREVVISETVIDKIGDLRAYLIEQLKMSQHAAHKRTDRIDRFLLSLGAPADRALCRFRQWRELDYRCATFEGWVFAYEIFDEGIIVRDMAHGKLLAEVDN